MAEILTDLERLRLYLRDRQAPYAFTDPELLQLLDDATVLGAEYQLAGAAAAGWMLKAASAGDAPSSMSIGRVSISRGGSDTYASCLRMHRYWNARAGAGVAQIMGMVPHEEGSLVGELIYIAHELPLMMGVDASRFEW